MAEASGLGDIFSCIKSSEELLLKKKRKLDDAIAAITKEKQRQTALQVEVRQRSAELERVQAQVVTLQMQLRLEEGMAHCLQTELQKQQHELSSSKKDLDAATDEAEDAVTALEHLATSTHEAFRLDGNRLLEGANRHKRALQSLLLEEAALRCEVGLREDLMRDVLRVRCCTVAALHRLQQALLRKQQLLRAWNNRQQQNKEQRLAQEKQQQLEVQRLESEALSVEDECLCLESLSAALRHELDRLNDASQARQSRKQEATRLCSTQAFAPASHLIHGNSREQARITKQHGPSTEAGSIGSCTGGLEGHVSEDGSERPCAEAVTSGSHEMKNEKRSTKTTDIVKGRTADGDVRSTIPASKHQDNHVLFLSAYCGASNPGLSANPSDSVGSENKSPNLHDEASDLWRDVDWDDALSVTSVLEEQPRQGQTSRNGETFSGGTTPVPHYEDRQHTPHSTSSLSYASSSFVQAKSSIDRNMEYQNKVKTVTTPQQSGHCGKPNRNSSEVKASEDALTPSRKLASAMRTHQAEANCVDRHCSNTELKTNLKSQFSFKKIPTTSVPIRGNSTYHSQPPTSRITNDYVSASSSNNSFSKSSTGNGTPSTSFQARNGTHNLAPNGLQTTGNTPPKTVRFKFQKTSMIQLRPVKASSGTQMIENSNAGDTSRNIAANVQRGGNSQNLGRPANTSTAPVPPAGHQRGNTKPLSRYNFQYKTSDPQTTNSYRNVASVNASQCPTDTRSNLCSSSNSASFNQKQFAKQFANHESGSFTKVASVPSQQGRSVNQATRSVAKQTIAVSPIVTTNNHPFQSNDAAMPQHKPLNRSTHMHDYYTKCNAAPPSSSFQESVHLNDGNPGDISLPEPVTFTRDSCPNVALASQSAIQCSRGTRGGSMSGRLRGIRGGRGVGRGAADTRSNGAKRLRFSN